MDDIPALQEQWERDWRQPGDALRQVQRHARGMLAPGSAPRVSALDAGVLDEQVETLLFEKLKKYTLKAYVDDSEVESITVSENVTVKLVYESTKEEPTKKGCKGSVTSSLSLISILSGAGFILLVSLKKKGGKKHE